jgi:hypothetical protein
MAKIAELLEKNIPIFAEDHPFWKSGHTEHSLEQAVKDYDFQSTPSWEEVKSLSHNTKFRGLGVSTDSAAFDMKQEGFAELGKLYVFLTYNDEPGSPEHQRGDATAFRYTFPVNIYFDVDKDTGDVRIKKIIADTSSF